MVIKKSGKRPGFPSGFCLFLLSLLAIGVPDNVFAQFILTAELRPRTEFRHGYATLASEASQTAIFTSQRSRLNLLFNHERYRISLSVQDVRVWGDEGQLRDEPSMAAHALWGEIDFTPNLSLRVGRQELVYDDHRLLGNVNWAQQARSHDAALFKFRQKNWEVHLAAAYNNERETVFRSRYELANYRSLFFLWIHHQPHKNIQISTIGIADGFQGADAGIDETLYRYTVGPHLQVTAGKAGLTGTFYYQFGTDRSGTDLNAYMFALAAKYQLQRLTIHSGIDFLSGTDAFNTTNRKINTFNTLYATNHKFYGWMDYFTNIPAHTANGGLRDLFAGVQYKTSSRSALSATFHQFSLAENIVNPGAPETALKKNLGAEIDAVFNYNFLPDLNIQAGYSVLFPTGSMEALKGGDKDTYQYWGWLMITIKPEILKIALPGK